jgi:YHS domain-containing protein
MIRLLFWLLLLYIGYRVIMSLTAAKKTPTVKQDSPPDVAVTYRDPVCGMYVSEDDAVIGRLNDQRHYFCSMSCLEKYREQLDHSHHS